MIFFKNKFLLGIFLIIFLLFSLQFYYILYSFKKDTNSYVSLVKWSWFLISSWDKKDLEIDKKTIIKVWDIVSTKAESLAVIEWWDNSITRLSENTTISIKENYIWNDLWKINISFELLKWNIWSNVVTMLDDDSNFSVEVKDYTAAVRWTVFQVDYENDIIWVHSHKVEAKNKDWKSIWVETWKTLNIKKFLIWDISQLLDKKWIELNKKLDSEYLLKLRDNIIKSVYNNSPWVLLNNLFSPEQKVISMISKWEEVDVINKYINELSPEKQKLVIQKMQTFNQLINFENWDNTDLYSMKLKTRELLIWNTTNEELKKMLIKYSFYDLSELKLDTDSFKITYKFFEKLWNIKWLNNDPKMKALIDQGNEFFRNITVSNIAEGIWKTNTESVNLLNKLLNWLTNLFKNQNKN